MKDAAAGPDHPFGSRAEFYSETVSLGRPLDHGRVGPGLRGRLSEMYRWGPLPTTPCCTRTARQWRRSGCLVERADRPLTGGTKPQEVKVEGQCGGDDEAQPGHRGQDTDGP